MAQSRYHYELIDNETGNTLTQASSSSEGLRAADIYIQSYNVDPSSVSYVILSKGRSTRVLFRVSGNQLAELIEDEKDAIYPGHHEFYDPLDDIDGGYT